MVRLHQIGLQTGKNSVLWCFLPLIMLIFFLLIKVLFGILQ